MKIYTIAKLEPITPMLTVEGEVVYPIISHEYIPVISRLYTDEAMANIACKDLNRVFKDVRTTVVNYDHSIISILEPKFALRTLYVKELNELAT